MIDYALLPGSGQRGAQVSEGEINQQLLLDQMQAGGAENFRQILKQEGMTESVQETQKVMIDKLQDYITKDVTVRKIDPGGLPGI